jgi:hypothetical protein
MMATSPAAVPGSRENAVLSGWVNAQLAGRPSAGVAIIATSVAKIRMKQNAPPAGAGGAFRELWQERFRAKWVPVRVKKTRLNRKALAE